MTGGQALALAVIAGGFLSLAIYARTLYWREQYAKASNRRLMGELRRHGVYGFDSVEDDPDMIALDCYERRN